MNKKKKKWSESEIRLRSAIGFVGCGYIFGFVGHVSFEYIAFYFLGGLTWGLIEYVIRLNTKKRRKNK